MSTILHFHRATRALIHSCTQQKLLAFHATRMVDSGATAYRANREVM